MAPLLLYNVNVNEINMQANCFGIVTVTVTGLSLYTPNFELGVVSWDDFIFISPDMPALERDFLYMYPHPQAMRRASLCLWIAGGVLCRGISAKYDPHFDVF